MKQLLTLTFLLAFIGTTAFAQTPAWNWATVPSAGPGSANTGMTVTTDAAGNVYTAGYYQSPTITFGSYTLTNYNTFYDLYLVKYDAAGNVLWAVTAGDAGRDVAADIALDAAGNIYMVGYFSSSSLTLGTTTLTNAGGTTGNNDIFIAKFDPTGAVLWATSAGGIGIESAIGIAVDGLGDMFISGYFQSPTLTFGSFTLNNAGTGSDIFVAKYLANGTVAWATSAGGTSSDQPKGMTMDANGDIYITGNTTSSSITFGTNTFTGNNLFVVKYASAGGVTWAGVAGGGAITAAGVAVDAGGNVYICGNLSSSITFGGSTLTGTFTYKGSATNDIFLAKYDALGIQQWARNLGGAQTDIGSAITIDAANDVYIAGQYASSNFQIGTTTMMNNGPTGSFNIYVAKYNSAGANAWVKAATGNGSDWAFAVAVDGSGNTYITGRTYSNPVSFAPINLTHTGCIYLAKLGTPCATNPVVTQSGTTLSTTAGMGSYQWYKNGLLISGATGNTYVATSNGTYYVTVTNASNCTTQSNAIDVSGIRGSKREYLAPEEVTISSIIIYPNPSNGQFTLQLPFTEFETSVVITDLLGRKVQNQTIAIGANPIVSIQLQDVAKGIYMLEARQNGEIFRTKLEVQ